MKDYKLSSGIAQLKGDWCLLTYSVILLQSILFTLLIIYSTHLSAQYYNCGDTIIDSQDGHKYLTVLIGTQCWFKVNLQAIKYTNGDTIPHIENDTAWANQKTGAWCDANNTDSNGVIFGHLYNWYTINDNRGLCPSGWHVPALNEWDTLINYLKGPTPAGSALKAGPGLWTKGDPGNNSSGFTALPGGWRCGTPGTYDCWNPSYNGTFVYFGYDTEFGSSTKYDSSHVYYLLLDYVDVPAAIFGTDDPMTLGLSVRCLKDSLTASIYPTGPINFCSGDSVVLKANAGTGYCYQWMTGSNNIPGQTMSTYTARTSGDYKVIVTHNSNSATSKITTVTVYSLTINVMNDSTTCGTPVVLNTFNNYTGSGTLTYNWQPTTGLSANNVSNPTANPGITTTYTVSLKTSDGCFATNEVRVRLTPLPAQQICFVEFDTVTLKNKINWATNLPANIDTIHIYTQVSTSVWKLIGTVPSSQHSFIDMKSNPYSQSYSYKISVRDTCGIESDTSGYHTTITLLATYNSGTQTYGFTWSAYEGLTIQNYYLYGIKAKGKDSLIASVPGNQYFYNYINPYPGFVNYFVGFFTAPCKGKIEYLVKSNYALKNTGINELRIKNGELRIYPNPANDVVTIDFTGYTERNKSHIELYNITGGLIKIVQIKSKITQLNISDLAKGVYVIKIINDNYFSVKRIVKE